MRITADTNLLVRALTGDDQQQSPLAQATLKKAEMVVLTLPALCELGWVLSRGYKIPPATIAEGIRRLVNGANALANRAAVEAGLAMLDAGGDFADGVIAYEGHWFGAESFVSFDKQAVKLLKARGEIAQLLS